MKNKKNKEDQENKGAQEKKINLETPAKGALNFNDEIKKLQEKNLELSQEILASSLYIKRYIKNVRIFTAIKWIFLILIVILGFLSFGSVLDYLQETISVYQNQVDQIVEQTNNVIK